MILLERNTATQKNRIFFIPDMENTRSKLSNARKSIPITNLQNALKSGNKKSIFS